MIKNTETAWLTLSEAIAVLGIGERTLRRYAASKRIPTMKIGRSVLYDVESFTDSKIDEAEEAGATIKSNFVAVIYDSRKNLNTVGRPIIRPLITFMLVGGESQRADGSFGRVWRNLSFCLGANLDVRLEAPGELITGANANEILTQPAAVKLVESGQLRFFVPESPEFGVSFRSYGRTDALLLIDSTYDLDSLSRYSQREDRAVVLTAIQEKRTEIERAIALNKTQVINADDFRRNYRGVA